MKLCCLLSHLTYYDSYSDLPKLVEESSDSDSVPNNIRSIRSNVPTKLKTLHPTNKSTTVESDEDADNIRSAERSLRRKKLPKKRSNKLSTTTTNSPTTNTTCNYESESDSNIINSTSSSSSESEPTTAKSNETRNSTFITTVAQRSSFYSKAEVKKAKEARDLFENMSYPTPENLKKFNMLK
jgi:hypothetical protein